MRPKGKMEAPHADVRVICDELGKLRSGLAAMGLNAPAIDAAIDMLGRQSFEIAGKATNTDAAMDAVMTADEWELRSIGDRPKKETP